MYKRQEYIVNMLVGNETSEIQSYKHNELEVFGSGSDEEEKTWNAVIRQALIAGYLAKDIENYGLLKITEKGKEFIKKPVSFKITEDNEFDEEEEEVPVRGGAACAVDPALFSMMKDLRKKLSKRLEVPPFVIFQDPSLEAMATTYPVTLEELQNIPGVGAGKAKRYGKEFIELIKKHVEENEIERPEDLRVRTVANKSKLKVSIIQRIDRKVALDEIALTNGLEFTELLDEIENVLGIRTCPINWPIGAGKRFKGVYDRDTKKVSMFQAVSVGGAKSAAETDYDVTDPALKDAVGDELYAQLMDEIELLDGASDEFDQELVDKGELSPVFFGSALTTFGVQTFLEHFLKMTQSPLPRMSDAGLIDPITEPFSGFVFKIQANMNKAHHDRIAFMRISSGKFDATKEVYHVQSGRKLRLSQPQQIMAQDRKVIDEAYAGDVIGVFDPGIFSIGDTLTTAKPFKFEGIPTFAPEHFARVRQVDTMKRKQFMKGMQQIAQEGAIQIFQEYKGGMEEIIVGVVGVLQFDVLRFRLENEYNVEIRLENLPYEHIRWIENKDEVDVDALTGTSDMKKVIDMKGNPLLLFVNAWSVGMTLDRNEGLVLSEFSKN